jgi:ABC-type Fe3+/spermidine/putrescine transport system ATPase subunit
VDVLREAGAAAIFVTHDANEALGMADRISVMHEGRILQTGTAKELYLAPRTRQVAVAVGEASFLRARDGDCALGRFQPRKGARGHNAVVLRPEDVVVGDGGVTATVRRATYTGHGFLLTCLVGESIVRAQTTAMPAGDTVTLRLRGPVATIDDDNC